MVGIYDIKNMEIPKDTKVTICTGGHFDAAHYIEGYKGKCSNIHGHRWEYKLYVTCKAHLDPLGMVADFSDVKTWLKKKVDLIFDHKIINEQVEFNPTAENLAIWIFNCLSESLNTSSYYVSKLEVYESPDSFACVEMVR